MCHGQEMFLRLGTFSIQNRSTISGMVPFSRQLIPHRFLGCLSTHSHQFECCQKAKTDEAYQHQSFHWSDEKGGLCFSPQWKFFQHNGFYHNNSTKNT